MNLRPSPLAAAAPLLFLAASAFADPALSVSLRPERSVYYVGERVDLDLTLDLDGVELFDGTLAPSGLPDHEEAARVGRLERVRTADPNVLAWTASLDFRGVGDIPLTPSLQGTLRRLRNRSGFVRQYEALPFRAEAPARVLTVREPPAEGRPDGFFGAVGAFSLEASFSPAEASPGDPVTLRWTLRGRGADLAAGTPPSYAPGPDFRTYAPRVEARRPDELAVTQVIVPLSERAAASPRFAVPVFDPARSAYAQLAAPALALRIVPRAASAPVPDAAARELAAAVAESGPRPGDRFRTPHTAPARLAPAESALRLFDLPAGSETLVRERHGAWARVLLSDGASGWILLR